MESQTIEEMLEPQKVSFTLAELEYRLANSKPDGAKVHKREALRLTIVCDIREYANGGNPPNETFAELRERRSIL
jgi:hypothetical protein